MIYSHKPQRSGRSIQANTNNPPQDPPPPPEIIIPETVVPDILIVDSTPPVPEICIQEAPTLPKPEKKVTPKPVKITWRNKLVSFFKKLFRRDA